MKEALLNFKPVRKAIDNIVGFDVYLLDRRVRVEGFTPVRISLDLSPRKTIIKSLYAYDCAICENEDLHRIVRNDSFGACQPRLSDIHLDRLDLNFEVPAMSKDACGKLSFRFWIRPPKGVDDVICFLQTDHVIPLVPATLVL